MKSVLILSSVAFVISCLPFRLHAIEVGGIISVNTIWDDTSEPYTFSDVVQVAQGVTLSVAPGVQVENGNIEVYGEFKAEGTKAIPVRFDNVRIYGKSHSLERPYTLVLKFCIFQGGDVGSAANTDYGTIALEDSVLRELSRVFVSYIGYRGGVVAVLRRNVIQRCGPVRLRLNSGSSALIENNFFDSPKSVNVYDESWQGDSVIRYNSFGHTGDMLIAQSTGGVQESSIDARNNYWGTVDPSEISESILDATDDLSFPLVIPFEPFLTNHHPDTPIPVQYTVEAVVVDEDSGTVKGTGIHSEGNIVTLTAVPAPGHLFAEWTGGINAPENPVSWEITGDLNVVANFVKDFGDSDGDGLTNYEEAVTYGTRPDLADTDSDGRSDKDEIDVGLDPLVDESATLALIKSNPSLLNLHSTLELEQAVTVEREGIIEDPSRVGLFSQADADAAVESARQAIIQSPSSVGLFSSSDLEEAVRAERQTIIDNPSTVGLFSATDVAHAATAERQRIIDDPSSAGLFSSQLVSYVTFGESTVKRNGSLWELSWQLLNSDDLIDWSYAGVLQLEVEDSGKNTFYRPSVE